MIPKTKKIAEAANLFIMNAEFIGLECIVRFLVVEKTCVLMNSF